MPNNLNLIIILDILLIKSPSSDMPRLKAANDEEFYPPPHQPGISRKTGYYRKELDTRGTYKQLIKMK